MKMRPLLPEFLTLIEISKKYGMCHKTLRKYVNEGKFGLLDMIIIGATDRKQGKIFLDYHAVERVFNLVKQEV